MLSGLVVVFFFLILSIGGPAVAEQEGIRAGWIGPITGPAAKYGAYEAVRVAVDEINAAGGINGKPLPGHESID